MTNAGSPFGRTLIRVLLASGQRVAAATNAQEPSPFTAAEDALLLLDLSSSSTSAINAHLDIAVEHFGRVDVVVNTPSLELPLSEGEPEVSRTLLEHVFWEPIHACTAVGSMMIPMHDHTQP